MADLKNTNIDGDLRFKDRNNSLGIPSGSIANRPSNPVVGSFRFNSDRGTLEIFNGTIWIEFASEGSRQVFYLDTDVVPTPSGSLVFPTSSFIEYISIAGGGGGGGVDASGGSCNRLSGGGGGGGVVTTKTTDSGAGSTGVPSGSFCVQTYTSYCVEIGAGGASNTNGNITRFGSDFAIGGGAGGCASVPECLVYNGCTGGSGGGGGFVVVAGSGRNRPAGAGVPSQGFNGYPGSAPANLSGGGGGAGGNAGYAGGAGILSTVPLSSTYFGGGGGGANSQNAIQAGGIGGGGNGATDNGGAGGGQVNTGGGGGGGICGTSNRGCGAGGGSGVLILRYPSTFSLNSTAGITVNTSISGSECVSCITAGAGTIEFSEN